MLTRAQPFGLGIDKPSVLEFGIVKRGGASWPLFNGCKNGCRRRGAGGTEPDSDGPQAADLGRRYRVGQD
jgi:hypothetical protein